MSKHSIIKAPDPLLRTVCTTVVVFNARLKKLAVDLFDTMHAHTSPKGIGLAANQIGRTERLIVTDVSGFGPIAFCNPEIEWAKGEDMRDELCLSEPGVRVRILRARKIRVNYQDLEGSAKSLVAQDLLARCIQHEIDHLNGILISDHLPQADRSQLQGVAAAGGA